MPDKTGFVWMWFLEEDPGSVSTTLDDTLHVETWLDFIEKNRRENEGGNLSRGYNRNGNGRRGEIGYQCHLRCQGGYSTS